MMAKETPLLTGAKRVGTKHPPGTVELMKTDGTTVVVSPLASISIPASEFPDNLKLSDAAADYVRYREKNSPKFVVLDERLS